MLESHGAIWSLTVSKQAYSLMALRMFSSQVRSRRFRISDMSRFSIAQPYLSIIERICVFDFGKINFGPPVFFLFVQHVIIMFASPRHSPRCRTSKIIHENFHRHPKNNCKPRIKSTNSNSSSTSPSPFAFEYLMPSKKKSKKTGSKLFEGAHETSQGETYLSTLSHQGDRIGSKLLEIHRSSKIKKIKKLCIYPQYSIKLESENSLSDIILQFEEGQEKISLSEISENFSDNSSFQL